MRALSGRRNSAALWLMLPVLLLAFWLGARGLDRSPIWGDEASSVYDAGASLYGPLSPVGVWNRVAGRNPWHSPGFFIAVNLWGDAAGWDPAALRTLSLLAGLLGVAMTYRLGRDHVSVTAGVVAALVLATSMVYVHYLSRIRMYTLIVFTTTTLLWLYLHVVGLRRSPGWDWWLALFAATAAVLYTHYLAALALVPIGLYHLLAVPKNRRWWQVAGVMAAGLLPFLPWVRVLATGISLTSDDDELHARALTAPEVVTTIVNTFANGAPLLALVAWAMTLRDRAKRARRFWLLAGLYLGALLLLQAALQIVDERRVRYLLGLWPLLALLAGIGISQLKRRQWILLATALWVAVGVWNVLADTATPLLHGHTSLFPLQRVAHYVDGRQQPGDVVVNYLADEGRRGREYENIASFYFTTLPVEYVIAQPVGAAEVEALTDLLMPRARIWLAYEPALASATRAEVTAWLDTQYVACDGGLDETALRLTLYARDTSACG